MQVSSGSCMQQLFCIALSAKTFGRLINCALPSKFGYTLVLVPNSYKLHSSEKCTRLVKCFHAIQLDRNAM